MIKVLDKTPDLYPANQQAITNKQPYWFIIQVIDLGE